MWRHIDSVHVFDDLDVVARADWLAAASAAKLYIRWALVLYVLLLLLRHSYFLFHYSLNLKLSDLMNKQTNKSLKAMWVFNLTETKNSEVNVLFFHRLPDLRI